MKTIFVKDFSKFPGPRYSHLGAFSGEEFRDTVLIPQLEKDEVVSINFDGVFGYGSSFLEEAFGGLVRKGLDIKKIESLKNNLLSTDPTIKKEVTQYLNDALAEAKRGR